MGGGEGQETVDEIRRPSDSMEVSDGPEELEGEGEEVEVEEGDEEVEGDEVLQSQVEAAELRQRQRAEVSLKYSNVSFTRVFLNDKDILKGFDVHRWAAEFLGKVIDDAVEKAEAGENVVQASMDENASELKQTMEEMGLGEGEMLPLSFGTTKGKGGGGQQQGGKGTKKAKTAAANTSLAVSDAGAAQLGLAVGDICDCYYEEDGRYYPARVDWMGQDRARVTYLGYEEAKKVPVSWLSAASEETRAYVASMAASTSTSTSTSVVPPEGSSGARNRHVRFDDEGDQAEKEEAAGEQQQQQEGGEEEEDEEEEKAVAAVKKGKKRRRGEGGAMVTNRKTPAPDHVPAKYWSQRFRLFSQFDRGCRLDEEGWYSVTPERISQHIAERSRCDVVLDCFVGCGGNAIQFAMTCHHVIAVDIDPQKLECARHNARIYGVEDRIEFILGDALSLLPHFKGRVDVIFLSPPWGGPEYLNAATYDLAAIQVPPADGRALLRLALSVTPHVAALLPRNVDVRQLAELADGLPCEIEEDLLNYKVKTTTVYYGGQFLPPLEGGAPVRHKRRKKTQGGKRKGGKKGQQAQEEV